MSVRGWVYVIDNAAMPGLVKVGYSTKDPVLRAKELAGTGTPHAYRVVFDALVEEPRTVEQAAHAVLKGKQEGKEWFRCSQAEAIAAIRTCVSSVIAERSNSSIGQPSAATYPRGDGSALCPYFECGKPATVAYKGMVYCDDHYKVLRNQRFQFARRLRDG